MYKQSCYLLMKFMTIVWNFISLSISLWSRVLISLIRLNAIKLDTISNKVMAATEKCSNQGCLSSLILSIKLMVLLEIIVMLTVLIPKSNWLNKHKWQHFILKTFIMSSLPLHGRGPCSRGGGEFFSPPPFRKFFVFTLGGLTEG